MHKYKLGVIGNCSYLSLIDEKACIQWLCLPKFDSSFIFGNLLDTNLGGEFSILPANHQYQTKQYYFENTNILCTEFHLSNDTSYRVIDFAPRFMQNYRYYKPSMLIRKIEPLKGIVSLKITCQPVYDYGKTKLSKVKGSNHIHYFGAPEELRLTTNASLSYIENNQEFVLSEPKYLALTYGLPLEAPLEYTCENFLTRTKQYWRQWATTTNLSSFHQEKVIRSALLLKILQYEDTGAIIAAPTTSLPESPGSTRNWDYRYCWLRDAYYIINAFNNIGHFEEMTKYFHYIENIIYKEDFNRIQPLYAIDTASKITERELEHLEGYKSNKPVRIGNQAHEHIQNDVYGQILLTLLPLYIDRRFISSDRIRSINIIEFALAKIEETMVEKDAGIWEFRNRRQIHCYTLLFHWAGSSAAYKIATFLNNKKLQSKALKLKSLSASYIEQCKLPNKNVYAQAINSPHLDASTLQLITMNYLDPKSAIAKEHLQSVEQELKSQDGLFYRYKHQDDFGKPDTTFLICAYWYIEALACTNRIQEAIQYFEQLNQYTNHLSLHSEDIEVKTKSQWGNFPQAYSHVGLINAAYRIATKLDLPNFY